MSCEIHKFMKSCDFWKPSGCLESPCSKPFIELDILLEWSHWSRALVIETTREVRR